MPSLSSTAVGREIADTAGFDLSDVDEVDIRRGAPSTPAPRPSIRDARRADRPDDVLAMCALLIFQDRPRCRQRRGAPRALPGL